MSKEENKTNGEWNKEATEKLTSILVEMIDKRIEMLGLQELDKEILLENFLESDSFSDAVSTMCDDIFQNNLNEADLDTHIENWFEYNATLYVEDMIQHWMNYNFSLSDYDDGIHDVENQLTNWIVNGCNTVDDYAAMFVRRAKDSLDRDSKLPPLQNDIHILSRSEYIRIMEVVDLIRPETKQVVKEQKEYPLGVLEDLLVMKIDNGSQLTNVINSIVDKYGRDKGEEE